MKENQFKNVNKLNETIAFSRSKCLIWGKRIGLYVVILLCGILVLLPFIKTFVDVVLAIAAQISNRFACATLSHIQIIYTVLGVIGLVFLCWIAYRIVKFKLPAPHDYNAEYLKRSLFSNSKNLPATSREDLLKKVAGKTDINAKYEKMITGYIDQNIDWIKNFLSYGDENVLVIEAPWGTGKTTSLLIAINEFSQNAFEYKYIYESAFKYTSGHSEYFHDILSAICQILETYGVKIRIETKDLMDNMSSDLPKTVLKVITANSVAPTLSSDMIFRINEKVAKKGLSIKIVVILDDLDRLDGDDIIKVLSFLSVIRRLNFVKVILPLDANAVASQLNGKVYLPKQFIQKYLPDQTSLHLKSGYEMVENVAIAIIKERMKLGNDQLDLCYPIWEATLLLMISRRIRAELDRSREYRYGWLSSKRIEQYENNKEWLHGVVLTILNAPHYAATHTEKVFSGAMGRNGYSWVSSSSNIRQFQHVIWALRRYDGNTFVRVCERFTEEDYQKVVVSWVRDYAKDNWTLLGFSLRDIINTINGEATVDISNAEGEMFVNAFNVFFPQSKLKYDATSETNEI